MRRAALVLGVLLLALPAGASRRRATHGNPHAEVTVTARVDTQPRRTRHRNRREFEEFRATLLSAAPSDPAAGVRLPIDAGREVRIVHDLTCGGDWIELVPGDRIEVRGEYVWPPDGRGLIHFTHPAGGTCGRAGSHVDGYLRPLGHPALAAVAKLDSFRASVRPILSVKCAPCHEPGGKMYGRLPFDDPGTVASHAARMATRLKGEDRKALESWAAAASAPQQR
ncbi:MAG: DUF3465 domain-containing protein [Acidobacteriota bacterium]|nr:DUF3465 domain-containing protein [Acidobacteriota bacterium]